MAPGQCVRLIFLRHTYLKALIAYFFSFMPSLQFSFVPWDYDAETIQISHTFTNLHAQYTDVIMERFKMATITGDPVNPPSNNLSNHFTKYYSIIKHIISISFCTVWWIAPNDRIAQYINDGECVI